MASSKTRQRKLARAKMERQMARRAAKVRRSRQMQAGVAAAVAVAVVVLGTVWALGGFSGSKKVSTSASCVWNKPANTANLKDVGEPPTSGEPRAGTDTMTITTNLGVITASLDLTKAPCTSSSFHYLASKGFFNNTKCHRVTTAGIYVLQCGDPSGTGSGGPTYQFANEYVPSALPAASGSPSAPASGAASASPGASASASAAASPSATASANASAGPSASPSPSTVTYMRGSLAMANAGADTNGSQFFIVYKDSQLPPNYTQFGFVSSGLDVVEKVAAGGAVDANGKATNDGKPKTDITIQSLTVTLPNETTPGPSGSASASGTPPPAVSAASPSPSPSVRS